MFSSAHRLDECIQNVDECIQNAVPAASGPLDLRPVVGSGIVLRARQPDHPLYPVPRREIGSDRLSERVEDRLPSPRSPSSARASTRAHAVLAACCSVRGVMPRRRGRRHFDGGEAPGRMCAARRRATRSSTVASLQALRLLPVGDRQVSDGSASRGRGTGLQADFGFPPGDHGRAGGHHRAPAARGGRRRHRTVSRRDRRGTAPDPLDRWTGPDGSLRLRAAHNDSRGTRA